MRLIEPRRVDARGSPSTEDSPRRGRARRRAVRSPALRRVVRRGVGAGGTRYARPMAASTGSAAHGSSGAEGPILRLTPSPEDPATPTSASGSPRAVLTVVADATWTPLPGATGESATPDQPATPGEPATPGQPHADRVPRRRRPRGRQAGRLGRRGAAARYVERGDPRRRHPDGRGHLLLVPATPASRDVADRPLDAFGHPGRARGDGTPGGDRVCDRSGSRPRRRRTRDRATRRPDLPGRGCTAGAGRRRRGRAGDASR